MRLLGIWAVMCVLDWNALVECVGFCMWNKVCICRKWFCCEFVWGILFFFSLSFFGNCAPFTAFLDVLVDFLLIYLHVFSHNVIILFRPFIGPMCCPSLQTKQASGSSFWSPLWGQTFPFPFSSKAIWKEVIALLNMCKSLPVSLMWNFVQVRVCLQ